MIGRLAHIGRHPEFNRATQYGAHNGMSCPENVVHSPIPGFEKGLTALGIVDTRPMMSGGRKCLIQGFPSYGLRE